MTPPAIISIERSVYEIWISVLGRENFGLNDDFFEVGGTTEAAVDLWKSIRKRFGFDLPLTAVYEAPTIGSMAMLLRGSASGSAEQSLVRLQVGAASHSPLYCFHPLGGSVARYSDLLSLLGADQPVFGLQSVGLTANGLPDSTIEEMADRYAAEICASPPAGRSIFLGFSLGGVLAMETALRVRHHVTAVPLVIVIDGMPHSRQPDDPLIGYEVLAKVVLNLDLDIESFAALPRDKALERIRAAAADRSLLPANFSLERLRRFADLCEVNYLAANRYIPQWFGGTLLLFRSSEAGAPWDLGWQSYVDEIIVHEIAGDHNSIMERKGMTLIARKLEQLICELRQESPAAALHSAMSSPLPS
jgi:thioesterase domain-containing protein